MRVLEELEKDKYWKETVDRMLKKDNLSMQQRAEVSLLYSSGFKDEFIEQVKNSSYEWSTPRKVLLNKTGTTKKRVVYMYNIRDRFVLGVLYRVFSEVYREHMAENCFSYKKGVRTLDAITYLKRDRDICFEYGVKIDIKAYFNSVDKEYLNKMLLEISDSDEIYKLLSDIYMNDNVLVGESVEQEYKSLIPGVAFGSFLANYALKDIDNYIANELNLVYARYSDDIIMFSKDEEDIHKALEALKNKLNELGLEINPKKYEWFYGDTDIDFLGLKIRQDGKVDVSDNSLSKLKRKIKHQCKLGRNRISRLGQDPYKVASDIIGRYNHKVYKCYIKDASRFGWAYYAFRFIDTTDSLFQLDCYLKDRIRQMITGKNNKANITKVTEEKLRELGYVSMVEMYNKFKLDFDYYCNEVDLIKG